MSTISPEFEQMEKIVRSLLTHTTSLMQHVYWVKQQFDITPERKHIATSIRYVDLQEFREEFLDELVTTIVEWVYSSARSREIVREFIEIGKRSPDNAQSKLRLQAHNKFRKVDGQELYSQGQFGELLLFNFIQYFFEAVPLLRKMRITTSIGHERFGADAIHYKVEDNKHILLLGESKVYTSDHKFKSAFEKSISSILTTYRNLNKELKLYVYDDFIDEGLERIAKDYKEGRLNSVEMHLVCLIAYNETTKLNKTNQQDIEKQIVEVVSEKFRSIDKTIFAQIEEYAAGLLPRMNYIVFPAWDLDNVIHQFQELIGG